MGMLSSLRNRFFPPRVVYRSLENPNMPLNDPASWESVFGDSYTTDTGETMTHDKALRYAPVWQAVSLISGDIAKLPLNLYRRRPDISDDARESASDDPRNVLVKAVPNESQSAVRFWRRVMVHALLWNNAYIWIQRNGDHEPIGLFTLLPDRTRCEHDGEYYITEVGGQLKPLVSSDVLHIEGIGLGKCGGEDMTRAARNSWALGLAQEKFASKFFKSGGRQGGILELPSGMPKPVRDTIEEGFRKSYEGVDNPFKTVILRDNAKFHAAQVSPRDSQMIEGNESQVRNVARWFNLSPSKLGLSDSVSYNSKAEDNQNYLDSTLSIWLSLIVGECNQKLLTEAERASMYFEHNTAALLRMNPLQRYQAYQIGIASRILSPNECRAKENMLPYDGGDAYENPNTSAQGGFDPVDDSPESDDEPEADEPAADPEPERHARRRVIYKIGFAARHRAAKGGKSFCDWLDHGWPDHRAESAALLGNESPCDEILEHLKRVAETATNETLAAEVEKTMNEIERLL